jgi:hypothetical protein
MAANTAARVRFSPLPQPAQFNKTFFAVTRAPIDERRNSVSEGLNDQC